MSEENEAGKHPVAKFRTVVGAMEAIPASVAGFISEGRVGRLGTADAAGQPLVVPICYAFDGHSLFSFPLLYHVTAADRRNGHLVFAAPETKRSLYRTRFQRAVQGHDPYSILNGHLARTDGWESTAQLQYADLKTYLPDGILTKVDRASMAHGLEARVPLLDHALVELAARLPSSSKVGTTRGKRILRKSIRGLVPAPILARRKRGFTPPVSRWLGGETGGVSGPAVRAIALAQVREVASRVTVPVVGMASHDSCCPGAAGVRLRICWVVRALPVFGWRTAVRRAR